MSQFSHTKTLFHLPSNVVYLDGNSLGPMPLAAREHVATMMGNEWGEQMIKGWNNAGWMSLSTQIGDRIAPLIGAEPGHVIMGDTLSIKVHQALAAALALNPGRKVILSDYGNFPSDLYIAQGLIKTLDRGHTLKTVAPEDVSHHIDDQVAVLMLTEVDYRTGRKHDMQALTATAHAHGVITLWDLAHSVGALPVDLVGSNVDFAVGCTYKYLNGGPGAPAFIYVCPAYVNKVDSSLSGWLGHAAPFDFELDYRAAQGIERLRVGTPPVIALKCLEPALDIWDLVTIDQVRKQSIALCELFIREVEARCPGLTLNSPRNAQERGSQVSFCFEEGYGVIQAMAERGVIGDFRAPDNMRFGFAPLYIDEHDVMTAATQLEEVISNRLWDQPKYKTRATVT